MNTLETLKAALAKIENPNHWIQGNYAVDAKGNGVHPKEPKAVCFCSVGALQAVSEIDKESGLQNNEYYQARSEFHKALKVGIVQFNDSHTHAEVIALWKKVIATVEAKGELE